MRDHAADRRKRAVDAVMFNIEYNIKGALQLLNGSQQYLTPEIHFARANYYMSFIENGKQK